MGLPPKSYFHLTELAECWGAPMPDLACYTLDGLLQIAVMTVGVCVDTGVFASTDRGLVRIPQCEKVLHGPQPVVSSDLWPVFRTGSGSISRFKPQTPDGYVDLAQGVTSDGGRVQSEAELAHAGSHRMAAAAIKRELKRRSAIEPVIGHMKAEGHLGRCYLKGSLGDAANAILTAIGHNLRLVLVWLRILLRLILEALWRAFIFQSALNHAS